MEFDYKFSKHASCLSIMLTAIQLLNDSLHEYWAHDI